MCSFIHLNLNTELKPVLEITSWIEISISYKIKYFIHFVDFKIVIIIYGHLWLLVFLVVESQYFKYIKLLFLPNDLTLLNEFSYDKIICCNTIYIVKYILICYVYSNILLYKLKKIYICIDEKVFFF